MNSIIPFNFTDIEEPKTYLTRLEDLVDIIEKELRRPCEYFIAGGAPSQIALQQKVYLYMINDIDIFFEDKEKMAYFLDSLPQYNSGDVTENAVSVYLSHVKIQAITLKYGTPEEILGTFDLNKSKIGITNDSEIITDASFYSNLHIDYKNFRGSTPLRYLKYLDRGFTTNDDKLGTIETMLKYISLNKLESSYSNKEADKITILKEMLNSILVSNMFKIVCVNDFMVSFSETLKMVVPSWDKRVKFFSTIYNTVVFKDKWFSEEYGLGMVIVFNYENAIKHLPRVLSSKNINLLRNKYPEEFI